MDETIKNPVPSSTTLEELQLEVSRRSFELSVDSARSVSSERPTPVELPAIWAGAPIDWGEQIFFRQGGNGLPCLRLGWSAPESNFVWSVGGSSVIEIQAPPNAADALLVLAGIPFTPAPRPTRSIRLLVNGSPQALWTVSEPGSLYAMIPRHMLSGSRPTTFVLQVSDPISPLALGISDDGRDLGFAMQTLELRKF